MIDQPFSPQYGATKTLAVGTTAVLTGVDASAKQIRILNTLAVPVFVRVSSAANNMPATLNDYPIAAGGSEVITKADTWGAVSVIASSGTGTVYITPGEGYSSGSK